MRPFFSSGGGVGATVEAARGRPAVAPCLALVREEEDDRWPVGPAGRPRPSGEGRENQPVGKKRMGRGWANRLDGPKAEENYFRIKF
jgi:hypothetical protein